MTKSTEIVNIRRDRFALSQADIIDALQRKYGEDPAFREGQLESVSGVSFLAGPEGIETEAVFVTEL
ncbi:hypothetical protein [Pseudomonas sp. Teo4]|uniref:hypothetical protein n=1 Tax=Pseudomonas sp. Teo4 TaxID=3064528 RepID=UPI002ABB42C7|nr:hypothetical protein [Pseudomonas sp. Teo4]MDZ3990381.1 hypothetical protein [Pseudomonas sp. Teo4]